MENRTISGTTGLCGVIGDPVEHTMSPAMHNAAFKAKGLDYIYLPFRVKGEALGKAIEGMRGLNIRGLNVTIPHKVNVIRFLDELDPLAEKIGAVNTIVNNNGVLKGYNTDAAGFLRALREKGIEPVGKNVVIMGAGGASRAISFVLAEKGSHLVILNRLVELDWAEELAGRVSGAFGRKVKALELNGVNLEKVLEKADILVNATSVGMIPHSDATPVASGMLKPGMVVFDIVYNPLRTRLLIEAEKAGAETISGLEMLVWQGALAFENWFGVEAPVEVMRAKIAKVLQGNEK